MPSASFSASLLSLTAPCVADKWRPATGVGGARDVEGTPGRVLAVVG